MDMVPNLGVFKKPATTDEVREEAAAAYELQVAQINQALIIRGKALLKLANIDDILDREALGQALAGLERQLAIVHDIMAVIQTHATPTNSVDEEDAASLQRLQELATQLEQRKADATQQIAILDAKLDQNGIDITAL